MPTVTKRSRPVAERGVQLRRWDNCHGYDVLHRQTGALLGRISRAGGQFVAEVGELAQACDTRGIAIHFVASHSRSIVIPNEGGPVSTPEGHRPGRVAAHAPLRAADADRFAQR